MLQDQVTSDPSGRHQWRVYGSPRCRALARGLCAGVDEMGSDYVLIPRSFEALRRLVREVPEIGIALGVQEDLTGLLQQRATSEAARKGEGPSNIIGPLSSLSFKNALYDHQVTGVLFLLTAKRAFLWDETGLGKTLTAGIAAHLSGGPTLIVTPKSAKQWWLDELTRWLHGVARGPIVVVDGSREERTEQLSQCLGKAWTGVCIVSWDYVRLHPELARRTWTCLIVDESHRAKNRRAQRSQALARIHAEYIFLLSATPMEAGPHELWAQLKVLKILDYRSYWRWFEQFVDYEETRWAKKPIGAKNEEILADILRPFAIKREHADCRDVPDLMRKELRVEMPRDQADLYNDMQRRAKLELKDGTKLVATSVMEKLIRLRQISIAPQAIGLEGCSGKLQALEDLVHDLPSSVNVVVFSCFRKGVELAENVLGSFRPTRTITGDTPGGERQLIANWLVRERPAAVVTTVQAGGETLNLQGAQMAVFLDSPWSSIQRHQAEGRIKRPGQLTEHVLVIDLVSKGTIDEVVLGALKRKRLVTEAAMSAIVSQELLEGLA